MANFLFPCIAFLDKLARLFSASPSRDVGDDLMVETDTLPLLVQLGNREPFPCQDSEDVCTST